MKKLMIVVLFFLSAISMADTFEDIQQMVAEHASKIGVHMKVIHVKRLHITASTQELGLAFAMQASETPLMMQYLSSGKCLLMYLPVKDLEPIFEDKDMLTFFVIHEMAHCSDRTFVTPNGRTSVLNSEQFADVYAMLYLQKHFATADYLRIMKKVMRFRAEFAKIDPEHDTWSVLAKQQNKKQKLEQDINAQANQAVSSLLDSLMNLI